MFYEPELILLRSTFRKCRVQTTIANISAPPDLRSSAFPVPYSEDTAVAATPLAELLPGCAPETVYRLTDSFSCRYIYFLLPDLPQDAVLILGPYLSQAPTTSQIIELCERKNLPPSQLHRLEGYMGSIPILPETSHLFVLLDAFAERIWGTNKYSVEDISHVYDKPLQDGLLPPEEKDPQWHIKNMEMRYNYESELMDAVRNGQTHKADLLFTTFSALSFEQRLSDPVRNAKNYCIIMNTLLRKAAQQGGVHPVHLDSTSSAYAARIEQLDSMDAVTPLMSEMFRQYCRLVRHNSLGNYSAPVQKAITYISAELTGNLTLGALADMLNINASYLSSMFKKETGQTLTSYVNQKRIAHAQHLLRSTHLQVQTVAQYCGIVDTQYFGKLFKRLTGQTPKEYRESTER